MSDDHPRPWHWHDAFGRQDGTGTPLRTPDAPRGQLSRFSYAVSDAKGFVVAHCTNALVTMSSERSEAHAKLLASAPDLLASLEELSEWMRSHTGPADGTHDMLVRAVEVIQQAGGTSRSCDALGA